ncbi:hypothetical protein FNF28_01867 [Cafeteria roenbergensis]|uniref:Uncharacterized protein n=1 Tax=Cafeteria roenbergensis TaxID=33653 RepID=A0A5A8DWX6_CAFRO|nr:hypothetical protein FNF28_01867 [Cafeteria roenbergensis]
MASPSPRTGMRLYRVPERMPGGGVINPTSVFVSASPRDASGAKSRSSSVGGRMYNLDKVGPKRGMAVEAEHGPRGYAILRSKAPRFGKALKEVVDATYEPYTSTVVASASLTQEVEHSARKYSSMRSRVERFRVRPPESGAANGPGGRGIPKLPTELRVRTAFMGSTPRFTATAQERAGGGARDAMELRLSERGPTADLAVAVAKSGRGYSVMRSTSPRFGGGFMGKRASTERGPRRPPASARGRLGSDSKRSVGESKDQRTVESMARDAESLTARAAKEGARDYGCVFRSKQPRFRAPPGDEYLRRRLAALDAGGSVGEATSLAAELQRSPRRGGQLHSTAPRFEGGARVDTKGGPATAAVSASMPGGVGGGVGHSRDWVPGPGSYDVTRGLAATQKAPVGATAISKAARFGKRARPVRPQPGGATVALSSRWSAERDAAQWRQAGVHIDRVGREGPAVGRRPERGQGADVVYAYDQAPSKRGLADNVASRLHSARGGMAAPLPRFSDPIAVRAGVPGLTVTSGARSAVVDVDYDPVVDTGGHPNSISRAAALQRHAGQSSPLRSRAPRMRAHAGGEGADVAYSVDHFRTIGRDAATSFKGASAMRRQGREAPVFRKDAAAVTWKTSAQDAAHVDAALVGGLSKLRAQRQRAAGGAAEHAVRPPMPRV